jgi:hypothetical protein
MNVYSMVCYPVGYHVDTFAKNKASLENKPNYLRCASVQESGPHGERTKLINDKPMVVVAEHKNNK